MPIDYSKFDNIGSEDEEEKKEGFAEVMQQCLRQLGERSVKNGEGSASFGDNLFRYADPPYAPDPGDIGAPDPFGDDPLFGDSEGGLGGASRPLDLRALRKEAFQLLVSRLVCRPSSVGIARALLLEAELNLLACQYHKALVSATALLLASSRSSTVVPWTNTRHRVNVSPPAGSIHEWAAPAMVIEMVAAYQLGDREHAVSVRDRLKDMPKDSLSLHLQKRFEGTSEILELVPQFLSLLKAADAESSRANAG